MQIIQLASIYYFHPCFEIKGERFSIELQFNPNIFSFDIFSAPQKSIQQMSKFSGTILSFSAFTNFQFRYLQSQTAKNIGIELYFCLT